MAVRKWESMMSKKARSKIGKKETKSKETVSPAPTPEPTPEPTPRCAPAPEPTPVREDSSAEEIGQPVSAKRSVIDWIRQKWWTIRFYKQL